MSQICLHLPLCRGCVYLQHLFQLTATVLLPVQPSAASPSVLQNSALFLLPGALCPFHVGVAFHFCSFVVEVTCNKSRLFSRLIFEASLVLRFVFYCSSPGALCCSDSLLVPFSNCLSICLDLLVPPEDHRNKSHFRVFFKKVLLLKTFRLSGIYCIISFPHVFVILFSFKALLYTKVRPPGLEMPQSFSNAVLPSR